MLIVATFSLLVVATSCRKPPLTAAPADSSMPRLPLSAPRASGPQAVIEPETGLWDVSAMAWAADAARLAVAEGSVIHVLEATGYREVLRIQTSAPRIAAVAFSPDGKVLAASDARRGEVVLWDLTTALERERMVTAEVAREGEASALDTLVFSSGGEFLSGRAWDRPQADVWTVSTARGPIGSGTASTAVSHAMPSRTLQLSWQQRILQGPRARAGDAASHPQMVAFSPDASVLLGVTDETLVTWAVKGPRSDVMQMFQTPNQQRRRGTIATDDPFHAVVFQPQGKLAAAGTESGAIVVWAPRGGKVLHSLATRVANPLLAFSRNGERLVVVAAMDGSGRTFRATSPGGNWTSGASFGPLTLGADAVAVAPDGTRIAVAAAGALTIRSIDSGQLIHAIRPPLALTAIALDRLTSRLAVGTAAGEIHVLTLSTGVLRSLLGHAGAIKALAFSDDGRLLVSGGADSAARIWEVDAARNLEILPQARPVNAVAVSADGRSVATAGEDGLVRLWDAGSGKLVATLSGNGCPILTVRFSPRGPLLAANTSDGVLLTWDGRTLAPRFTTTKRLTCPAGEISGWPNTLDFTDDGKTIGYAGPEGRLKWWNVDTSLGTTLGTTADALPARAVAVSRRDALLIAATADGLRAWSPPDPRGQLAVTTSGHHAVSATAFAADGRFLFALDGRGLVTIWEVGRPADGTPAAMPPAEDAPPPTPLTLRLTVALFDRDSGYVRSASAPPIVQWLGNRKPSARCSFGSHLQNADACAAGGTSHSLLRATLFAPSGPPGENP